MTLPRVALTALALTLIAPAALAQTPPAAPPAAVQAPPPAEYAPPPADYAPPPAGYAPSPSGYAPPGGYMYPPPYRPAAPLGKAILPYSDGYPIPDGYHPEKRLRTGLIIGGAVTFGVMYSFTAAIAAASKDGTLAVPILGPFLELGRVNFSSGGDSVSFAPVVATILVIDGLAQIGGVAMLIAGATTKKDVLVRNDVAKTTVRVLPMTMGYGGMGAGIGVVGTM